MLKEHSPSCLICYCSSILLSFYCLINSYILHLSSLKLSFSDFTIHCPSSNIILDSIEDYLQVILKLVQNMQTRDYIHTTLTAHCLLSFH